MTKPINTKITFSAPQEFKETLNNLKEEYNLKSVSTLLQEAVKSYIQQKEIERWEKGANMAANDEEYQQFCEQWSNDVGGLHEY